MSAILCPVCCAPMDYRTHDALKCMHEVERLRADLADARLQHDHATAAAAELREVCARLVAHLLHLPPEVIDDG